MPLARPSALALTPLLFAAVIAGATACSSTETTGSGGGSADDGEARVARITVKRSLGTLFDGIDLASATDEVLAGRVLENLALHVEAKVELWSLTGG
jgi:hypothetical protein